MKAVIQELLHKYVMIESKFQQGPYDKCVKALRDEYKDDVEMVVCNIFSHAQVAKKNILTIMLIVSIMGWLCLDQVCVEGESGGCVGGCEGVNKISVCTFADLGHETMNKKINIPFKPLSTASSFLRPFLIGSYHEMFTCLTNYDKA